MEQPYGRSEHVAAPPRDDVRYDAQLARHLLELAELMIRTSEIDTVLSRLVDECALLVGVDAVGLLLADGDTGVRCVAFSSPRFSAAGALEERTTDGPTVDVLRRGDPLEVVVAEMPDDPWPVWTRVVGQLGVRRVTCLPLRLVDEPVGGLELYSSRDDPLLPLARQVAGVFASLAVVVVRHATELEASSTRAHQLERALDSRVVVEQAKGFLHARGFDGLGTAFEALRGYSRRTRQRIDDVASAVITGELTADELRREPSPDLLRGTRGG